MLDAELPEVSSALQAAGALRVNHISVLPTAVTGGWRDGDDFEMLTGRRPVVEAVLAESSTFTQAGSHQRCLVIVSATRCAGSKVEAVGLPAYYRAASVGFQLIRYGSMSLLTRDSSRQTISVRVCGVLQRGALSGAAVVLIPSGTLPVELARWE